MHYVEYLTRDCLCHAARPLLESVYNTSVMIADDEGRSGCLHGIMEVSQTMSTRFPPDWRRECPVLFDNEAKFGVSNRQGLCTCFNVNKKMLKMRGGMQKLRRLMRLQ